MNTYVKNSHSLNFIIMTSDRQIVEIIFLDK